MRAIRCLIGLYCLWWLAGWLFLVSVIPHIQRECHEQTDQPRTVLYSTLCGSSAAGPYDMHDIVAVVALAVL